MRLIWTGFLMTSLLLIGLSALERLQTPQEPAAPGFTTCEDGTPMPPPNPKK
jgi:hypothetical protein